MVVPLPEAFIRFLISINRFWKFQYEVEEIATRLLDFHYNITVVSIFIIILVISDMQQKSCFKFIIFEVFCNKCSGTILMWDKVTVEVGYWTLLLLQANYIIDTSHYWQPATWHTTSIIIILISFFPFYPCYPFHPFYRLHQDRQAWHLRETG